MIVKPRHRASGRRPHRKKRGRALAWRAAALQMEEAGEGHRRNTHWRSPLPVVMPGSRLLERFPGDGAEPILIRRFREPPAESAYSLGC